MKKTPLRLLSLTLSACIGLPCCTTQQADPDTGTLQLTFDNIVGSQDLQLTTGNYRNAAGEQFSVTQLTYFVSNIQFQRADGTTYTVPQDSSYFLIRESDPSSQILTLRQIPTGTYTGLTYLIGVDSLRSTMDISRRKGVLEPGGGHNSGMYWDWNSGYIFFKLEGICTQMAPDPAGEKRFQFHIGLFGGYDTKTINNLRTISIPFGANSVALGIGQQAQVTIQADVAKVFDGSTRISIATNPNVMVSPFSTTIANNYAGMFRFDSQSTH
ncbi:hypothetical protein GCM10028805_57770 [Spirosoma harenae]